MKEKKKSWPHRKRRGREFFERIFGRKNKE